MTDQETIDRSAAHLLKQGGRSIDRNGNCRYRGDNGEMCAIGCLIPDEDYSLGMEGRSVLSLMEIQSDFSRHSDCSKTMKRIGLTNESLLSDIQQVHDMNGPMLWVRKLIEVSEKHGLLNPYRGAV